MNEIFNGVTQGRGGMHDDSSYEKSGIRSLAH
jgi:hypothetical protein